MRDHHFRLRRRYGSRSRRSVRLCVYREESTDVVARLINRFWITWETARPGDKSWEVYATKNSGSSGKAEWVSVPSEWQELDLVARWRVSFHHISFYSAPL